MINEYTILMAYSYGELAIEVNKYLSKGYIVHGNLVVDNSSSSIRYFQVVLKDKR